MVERRQFGFNKLLPNVPCISVEVIVSLKKCEKLNIYTTNNYTVAVSYKRMTRAPKSFSA